ncbi:MAG: thioredoxin [Gracilimonas sp.]|uniref:thioredoxin n=1 Tax=Gracilimonas TaxID=649462 RepID=UPI001B1C6BB5|nr:thioredoxin [Gracilimonas sp.]MBO6586061.1 thioredoxin [Gracilimonas sp.]MBO6614718.1 thioredoxin [Gracilimonas sp.]
MESNDTKKKSFSELIKGETPVLVDFYADWCAPCKMMPPILKQLKSEMGDRLNIIKIDTERNPDVAIRYQVRGIPNLILFRKGEVLWQQAGVVQMPQLKQIIEQKLEQS